MSILIWIILIGLSTNAQDAYHLRLLGNWNNPDLPPNPNMPDQRWNELTGYVDSTSGKEYVIMGSTDSVYFFDVSDPEHIKLCDRRWGLNTAINRDIETYSHYVYCVSDNAPAGKLQIYDLQFLPDSVHLVYESDTLGHNTHSIFINSESKRLYMCINKKHNQLISGLDILSLEIPDSPAFIGKMDQTLFGSLSCQHVHEIYVRNDTGYCSCEYKGLYVIDFTDLANQKPLGSISPPYPYSGYNHTSWVDSTGEYIAFTDEAPHGLPVKIYQIRELNDMTYLTHFNTHTGATPHNIFWVSNKLYISWYQDGVYIYTVDTPRNPRMYAYYDTYPQNASGVYDNYKGCWGVYPYFPSGNIAASDMTNGLFMLKYDITVGTENISEFINRFTISPSPFKNDFNLQFISQNSFQSILTVNDIHGREVYIQPIAIEQGQNTINISTLSELNSGIYFVTLKNKYGILHHKLVKE